MTGNMRVEEKAHAELGASSSHRWMHCPGSIRMSRGMPSTSNIYAREGTAAHELVENCLRRNVDARIYLGERIVVGNDSFEVDEDMVEAVQVMLDVVREIYQPGDVLMIEERVDLTFLYPGLFGTTDVSIYRPSTRELWVIDYKHGKGVSVEVVNNPQLNYYGIGSAIAVRDRGLSNVHMIIVQPRAPHADGPVRRWTISAINLLDWAADLVEAAKATEAHNAPLVPGDWCGFCPAAGECPALRDRAKKSAGTEFATPEGMSGDQLSQLLEDADLIEDWIHAVRANAYARMEQGCEIPGFKLVAKRATRKWDENIIEHEIVKTLVTEVGLEVEDIYKRKLLSPPQIEKLLDKTEMKLLEPYVVKVSTGNTIARWSDKREAIKSGPGVDFA